MRDHLPLTGKKWRECDAGYYPITDNIKPDNDRICDRDKCNTDELGNSRDTTLLANWITDGCSEFHGS